MSWFQASFQHVRSPFMRLYRPLAPSVRSSVTAIQVCLACHLFLTHVLLPAPASGPSMLPTISTHGDLLLTSMWSRRGHNIRVGDMVLYKIPVSKHERGCKRVIGMPGDYVIAGTPGEPGETTMIKVPEGHCWVAGDNLIASRDSRLYGPLPLALIEGKVVAKVLPWAERVWYKSGTSLVHQSIVREEKEAATKS